MSNATTNMNWRNPDGINYAAMPTDRHTIFLTRTQAALIDDRLEIDMDSDLGEWFNTEAENIHGSWNPKTKTFSLTTRMAQILWEDLYYWTEFDGVTSSQIMMAFRICDMLEACSPDGVEHFRRIRSVQH